MSHTVEIKYRLDAKSELSVCNSLEENISKFDDIYKEVFNSEIKKLKSTIAELRTFVLDDNFSKEVDLNTYVTYQKKLDSLSKKIANLNSLDLSIFIEKIDQKNNQEWGEFFSKNGIVAQFAINELESTHSEITLENAQNKLNEIINLKINKSKKQELEKSVLDQLYSLELGENVENFFLDKLNDDLSFQEMLDLNALIAHVVNEKKRVQELKKIIIEILPKISFRVISSKVVINENGQYQIYLRTSNRISKTMNLTISSTGVDYKMGNYVGHMCEKESNSFFELLSKKIKIIDKRIIRNVSNAKPILRARKLKERAR